MTLQHVAPFFETLICAPAPEIRRGPPRKVDAQNGTQRSRKCREEKNELRQRFVAMLDFETDPFDNVTREKIYPFAACLYSDQFEPVIIWEENFDKFVSLVVAAIEALPDKYTIYAHNGGRFDFMFFVHKLRGQVMFNGRGIMCAKIGPHELRDSFHIIPEKLGNIQKDHFDYQWMRKHTRNDKRAEITRYMVNDCIYLFDIIKEFLGKFGFKISIGQAAMFELKKHYTVKKFTKGIDGYIRNYFFGGRVECLAGRGHFKGEYRLYDVNSMYPYVMANYQHPIGGFHEYRWESKVGPNTVFLRLRCKNNGALVKRTDNNETTAGELYGEFQTTIWEYETALRHNLISDVEILECIDCHERTDFREFVTPLYENRLTTKRTLGDLKARGLQNTSAWVSTVRDDIFYKLLLNNAYGKFAQNPRKFKEHYITDAGDIPPLDWFHSLLRDGAPKKLASLEHMQPYIGDDDRPFTLPHFEHSSYSIWQKPSPGFRFNNVGTAASITGAARAVLLEAMQTARDPLYCDTDSIICRELKNVSIDKTALGSWDIESDFSEVIICGKKLYGCKVAGLSDGHPEQIKIRSKGINRDPKAGGLSWGMLERMLAGGVECIWSNAPMLNKYGEQKYIPRRVKATAEFKQAA